MINIDPRLLRCFLTVVHEGNRLKAAEQLGISLDTVGVRLRQLQEELGNPLFHRGHPKNLTDAGRELVPKATKLLRLHDDLFSSIGAGPDPREVERAAAIALLELALDVLRHDLRDEDRERLNAILRR